MRGFQREKGWKYILKSWPVLTILCLFLVFFAWQLLDFLGRMQVTKENRALISGKVIELQKEKEKLTNDIEKLNTEEGKEASIREKFGLVKDGESVIIIVEDKSKSTEGDEDSGGFFSSFFNWFK